MDSILSIVQLVIAIQVNYIFVGYAVSTRLFSSPYYTARHRLLFSVPLSVLLVTYFSIFFLKVHLFNSLFLWFFFVGVCFISLKRDILLDDYRKIKEKVCCICRKGKIATIVLPVVVFLLIILSHYIKQTILYFPSHSVSWIYYALARELAEAGKFTDIFIQYGEPLPRIYSYLAFDVFTASLIKMTTVSNLLFMYVIALVNLVLCITFLYFFLREYFSSAIALIAVIILCSYPLPYGGLAPRVWSHYWPEVLSFTLATVSLHMIICGLQASDYRLAVLNGFVISLIYMVHPVPFAVLMMFVVLIIAVSVTFGCRQHLKSYIVCFGITFTIAILLSLLLPLALTGSNALVEYIRGASSAKVSDGQIFFQTDSTAQYLSFFFNGIPTSSPVFKDYFHWGRGAAYYQWPLAIFTVIIIILPFSFFRKLSLLKKKIVLVLVGFLVSCLSVGFLYYFVFDFFTLKRAGFYRFLPYTLLSIAILIAVSLEYMIIMLNQVCSLRMKYLHKTASLKLFMNIGAIALALFIYVAPTIAEIVTNWEDYVILRHENFEAYGSYHWIKDNTEEDAIILTSYVSTGSFRELTGRNSLLDGAVAPGVKYKGALPDPNKNFLEAIKYFKTGDYSILERNKITYLFLTNFHRTFFGLRSYAPPAFMESAASFDYLVLVKKTRLFELYRVIGDISSMIIEYQRNIENYPDDVKNYLVLARLYNKLSQNKQTEELYRQSMKLFSDRAEIRLELGQFYQEKKLFDDANKLYRQAFEINPDDLFICDSLMQIYSTIGDQLFDLSLLDKIVITYERYTNNNPSDLQSYYKLAEIYQTINQIDKAVSVYQKVFLTHPDNSRSHCFLGDLYSKIGQLDKAIKQYQAAIELDPENGWDHRFLGDLYRNNGQWAKAIEQYQAAVKLDPENSGFHYLLGQAYQETGFLEKAKKQFEIAIRLDPENGWYHRFLGQLYELNGKSERALKQYQQAVRLDSENTSFHYLLGNLYQRMDYPIKALEQYKELVRLDPENLRYQKLVEQFDQEQAPKVQ